jgi:hypothetical protein
MAILNVPQVPEKMAEFARKLAAENKATAEDDAGMSWKVEAHPRLVVRRSTFNEFFGDKPVWDADGLWRGLLLSREGIVTKYESDEIIIED